MSVAQLALACGMQALSMHPALRDSIAVGAVETAGGGDAGVGSGTPLARAALIGHIVTPWRDREQGPGTVCLDRVIGSERSGVAWGLVPSRLAPRRHAPRRDRRIYGVEGRYGLDGCAVHRDRRLVVRDAPPAAGRGIQRLQALPEEGGGHGQSRLAALTAAARQGPVRSSIKGGLAFGHLHRAVGFANRVGESAAGVAVAARHLLRRLADSSSSPKAHRAARQHECRRGVPERQQHRELGATQTDAHVVVACMVAEDLCASAEQIVPTS